MVLDKIIKELSDYFDKGEIKKKKHCNAIEELLDKLRDKKKKLEKKLEDENNTSKRKHIKLELKIIAAQLKKGDQRRKELNKCKNL